MTPFLVYLIVGGLIGWVASIVMHTNGQQGILLNIVVGIVTIAYIWGGAASYPHYIFIATVETLCLLLIVWFAWTWRNVEA